MARGCRGTLRKSNFLSIVIVSNYLVFAVYGCRQEGSIVGLHGGASRHVSRKQLKVCITSACKHVKKLLVISNDNYLWITYIDQTHAHYPWI